MKMTSKEYVMLHPITATLFIMKGKLVKKGYKLTELDNLECPHEIGTFLSEIAVYRSSKPSEIRITGKDIINLITNSEYLGEL